MSKNTMLLERFHGLLVDEIRLAAPEYLHKSFSVAEIYQSLVPYRTHRDRLGVEINGDYEDILLRLLAGEGGYLVLESEPARNRILKELKHPNPNTGIYREFAAVGVRLNPDRISGTPAPTADRGSAQGEDGTFDRVTLGAPVAGQEDSNPSPFAGVGPIPDEAMKDTDQGSKVLEGTGPTAKREGHRGLSANLGGLTECPDCSAVLPIRDSLRFCPHCGGNVIEEPCEECGEILERSWKFCVACGHATGS